jgi:GntR family transcriptional regulator, N-acetylglucosamine utilization regulator
VRLQRESPDPLYTQLKASLVSDISSGQYVANQRLPSERELSTRFNVSRMTVRQALLELARDGVIYTRTGKGTFVAEPKIDQRLRTLSGFTQDVNARGGKPSSRVLEFHVTSASPDVAVALRLPPGSEMYVLTRLRLADNTPLAIETAYLPFKMFPGLFKHDFTVESLYAVLEEEYNCILTQAEQTIEAALAGKHEAELLEAASPAPIFRIQRLSMTSDGRPVEYVISSYRGDRYKFHSVLLQSRMSLS